MPEPNDPTRRSATFDRDSVSSSATPVGKSWFFGIGINVYKEFPSLNNATKDVKDILALLKEEYDFDSENIITLFDEEATRKNIIDNLYKLERSLAQTDKLLIYYSGHGHLDKHNNQGYWIPTDAECNSPAEYIPNYAIREYIKNIKTLHTLLISDACFSGSLFVRGAKRSTDALHELASRPSRWAICSGRHNEQVYDGEPGKNSPFAESVLYNLKHNQEKEYNVSKLADQVTKETRANYEGQLPEGSVLFGTGDKGGQYIFRRRADEAEDWATATAAASIPAYRQYLKNHPGGAHADAARDKIFFLEEEDVWAAAQQRHTTKAYYDYREAYPSGRYRHQALEAMGQIEEEDNWKLARRQNSLFYYEQYRDKYPAGKYREEAQAAIDALLHKQSEAQRQAEDRDWESAQAEASEASYEGYLRKYPSGHYAEVAKAQLAELGKQARKAAREKKEAEQRIRKEDQSWETAAKKNSVKTYQAYLQDYPEGRYAEEAKNRMAELEQAAEQAAAEQKRAEEARQKEEQYRQQAEVAWQQTKKKDTAAAYEAFLQDYSKSPLAAKAQTGLQDLRQREQQTASQPAAQTKQHFVPPAPAESVQRDTGAPEWVALLKKHGRWAGPLVVVLLLGGWMVSGGSTDTPQLTAQEVKNNIIALGIDTSQLKVSVAQNQLTVAGQVKTAADSEQIVMVLRDLAGIEQLDATGLSVAPTPVLRTKLTKETLTVSVSEGTPSYTLQMSKGDKTTGEWTLTTPGDQEIQLDKLQKDPGTYRLEVKDKFGQSASKEVTIEPPRVEMPRKPSGEPYDTVHLAGLIWLAENLNEDVAGSACYKGKPANCEEYGRLYTWNAAKAACEKLGWRLPTDDEWQQMAEQYGGAGRIKSGVNGKAAYRALIKGGKGDFNALLGGYSRSIRQNDDDAMNYNGHYWTNTEFDRNRAYKYRFRLEGKDLLRFPDNKDYGFSCRCVKDAPEQ